MKQILKRDDSLYISCVNYNHKIMTTRKEKTGSRERTCTWLFVVVLKPVIREEHANELLKIQ